MYHDKAILLRNVPDDWKTLLDNDKLDQICKWFGEKSDEYRGQVTPPCDKVFAFARYCNLSDIKIVVCGQDPYPKKGEACGLSFSCSVKKQKSLTNIYKCLIKQGLLSDMPAGSDISALCSQGVLLLNSALTTIVGKAGKHMKIWKSYTDDILRELSKMGLIFMLWGNPAKKKASILDSSSHMLKYGHPSPLGQRKNMKFVDCKNFTDANEILKKQGDKPINYEVLLGDLNNDSDSNSDGNNEANGLEKYIDTDSKYTVIFTDGSCWPNNTSAASVGGYGIYFAKGAMEGTTICGNIFTNNHYASNNRAEGQAIYAAMKHLHKNIDKWDEALFICDTNFWIEMFTIYMPGWERKGIDFKEKKNPDMTTKMHKLHKYLNKTKTIKFKHVKSHNKSKLASFPRGSFEYFCYENNDYVDELADFGRKKMKMGTFAKKVE